MTGLFGQRFAALASKEIREILRDRRTIITLILMPLLLYPLLAVAFRQYLLAGVATGPGTALRYFLGFESDQEQAFFSQLLLRGETLLQAQARELMAATPAAASPPQFLGRLVDHLDNAVQQGFVDVGLRLVGTPALRPDRDIALDLELVYNPASLTAGEALGHLTRRFDAVNTDLLAARFRALRVEQRPLPLLARMRPVSTGPVASEGLSFAAILPLVLILMTITGAVYPAIDLTAGERERGTLEILVAAPVPRFQLLLAKYVAVMTVALLTAGVNLGMMALTLWVSELGPAVFGKEGLPLGGIVLVVGLLVLFTAFFSAVLLILTSFARSFKEAQAYLIPLMLAALAPGMAGLAPGLQLSGLLTMTPLLNIVLLSRDLLSGGAEPAVALVVMGSTLLYALAALALAARVFGSAGVLYGTQTGWAESFRRPAEPQPAAALETALFYLALLFPAHFFANSLVAQLDSGLAVKLLVAAAVALTLFAGVPLLLARWGRVTLTTGLRLQPSPGWGWCAAVCFGLSCWPFAHELVLLLRQVGLAALTQEQLERTQALLVALRGVSPLLLILCMAIIPGAVEELFFRGYLFAALQQRFTPLTSILTSAGLFGMFHLVVTDGLAVERFLPSTLLGMVLGGIAWRTGSVGPSLVMHVLHNGLLVTAATYQQELAAAGIGVETGDHLPPLWLAAATVGVVLGGTLLQRCPLPPMPPRTAD